MGAERLGRLAPSDPAEGAPALRARFDADGYLWLKGFLPRADVLDFRRHFFAQFADTGLIAEGSDAVEGIWSGSRDNDAEKKRLMEVVRSAAYESFCLHPRLWRFMDEFVAGRHTCTSARSCGSPSPATLPPPAPTTT